ncbi:MAG: SpoIIE family protein phosphatase [Phycisphaeraceae bacterium]|nr:SpoIIE family protein phosphatase [Phycisphaeraceae bacterium]
MKHEGHAIEFECLSGPHPASFTAAPGKTVQIGRAATSDVCLTHEAVSRRHAMVVHRGGAWFVVDHGSRLGTFLNGVKVEKDHPATIALGDLLRIGPWTFRAKAVGGATVGPQTIDDTQSTQQRVERVGIVAQRADRRLRLLTDCLGKLASAGDEKSLARAAIESALEGSGFARGAILRRMGGGEEVELVDSIRKDSGEFVFSRSLVRRAATGETGVLTVDRAMGTGPTQHSIADLRIHSALCAPVFLGGSVESYLYLDARGQEQAVHAEAAGYCEAVARAYGLAVSSLKRMELQARHATLERDLKAAHEAQRVMLPSPEGTVGPIQYASQVRPGLFVAGDMFDMVPLPEGKLAVCVGDVSGHGVGSAMLMALAQSYLHAQLVGRGEAGAAVTEVNAFVAERSAAGRFASLWVGIFWREGGKLMVDFVDAGHGHCLLKRPGSASRVESEGEIPIGIDAERKYRSERLELGPLDRLVLYSDGIIEQRGPEGDEFQKQRLIEAIAASASPEEDVRLAFAAVEAHCGGSHLDDDATVVSLKLAD